MDTFVSSARWITTLRTVNIIEGFLPVPAHARGSYPARPEGAGLVEVLRGKWFDTGDDLWLWLDRADDRLYGPDLADRLEWCSTGERVHADWTTDVVVLRTVGVDSEIQEEEARLVDREALKELRGGVGETYRQSLVAILMEESEGLTFPELVAALRAHQGHPVHRGTIRALLSAGGFIQRGSRWFISPDTEEGARRLRHAIAKTYLPADTAQDDLGVVLRGVRSRLHEIVESLRRSDAAR